MAEYVILEHDHPTLHWDLMLDTGTVLRTWRLSAPPQAGQTDSVTALGDHRRAYLDYEGPVSGDRGQVKRWDWGTYELELDIDDQIVVRVLGRRFQGLIILERIHSAEWIVTYPADLL